MPKRRTDPVTGEPTLTHRENRLVEEYVASGGDAARAAVEAGYSPKNPSQSAYKVLSRPEVQERIRSRVAQAEIQNDEILGSLASQMRADVTDCFGPDGGFSVDLAREKGLGHLLKVSTTIQRKQQADGTLKTTGDTTKIEFLSPQAAAVQLSKLRATRDAKRSETGESEEDRQAERLATLERIISGIKRDYPHKTRENIIATLREVKPHFGPDLDRLEALRAASRSETGR